MSSFNNYKVITPRQCWITSSAGTEVALFTIVNRTSKTLVVAQIYVINLTLQKDSVSEQNFLHEYCSARKKWTSRQTRKQVCSHSLPALRSTRLVMNEFSAFLQHGWKWWISWQQFCVRIWKKKWLMAPQMSAQGLGYNLSYCFCCCWRKYRKEECETK